MLIGALLLQIGCLLKVHYLPKGMSARIQAEKAFREAGFDISGKYIEKEYRGGKWVSVDKTVDRVGTGEQGMQKIHQLCAEIDRIDANSDNQFDAESLLNDLCDLIVSMDFDEEFWRSVVQGKIDVPSFLLPYCIMKAKSEMILDLVREEYHRTKHPRMMNLLSDCEHAFSGTWNGWRQVLDRPSAFKIAVVMAA